MKLLFALVLPILSLVAANPTQLARQVITALDEPRFVPIEECGNRIACALADDGQLGREICNDYVGTTFVESPYCFNTVFLCSFNRVVKSCWYPVSGLKRNCNKPLQCAPDLPLVKGSSNTTEPIVPTTAAPDLTDESRFVPIKECGNRKACALEEDSELGKELCNNYIEPTFIESPYCFNTVFLCSYRRAIETCWYNLSWRVSWWRAINSNRTARWYREQWHCTLGQLSVGFNSDANRRRRRYRSLFAYDPSIAECIISIYITVCNTVWRTNVSFLDEMWYKNIRNTGNN